MLLLLLLLVACCLLLGCSASARQKKRNFGLILAHVCAACGLCNQKMYRDQKRCKKNNASQDPKTSLTPLSDALKKKEERPKQKPSKISKPPYTETKKDAKNKASQGPKNCQTPLSDAPKKKEERPKPLLQKPSKSMQTSRFHNSKPPYTETRIDARTQRFTNP